MTRNLQLAECSLICLRKVLRSRMRARIGRFLVKRNRKNRERIFRLQRNERNEKNYLAGLEIGEVEMTLEQKGLFK
jgi:hypothetical protein